MPKAEFFAHFGIYVQRNFLSRIQCQQIYKEMLSYPSSSAGIYYGLNRESRKVSRVEVPETTREYIKTRYNRLMPELSEYFRTPLQGFQDPDFLHYQEGDFYVPHIDRAEGSEFPDYIQQREVSVVLFINSQNTDEEEPVPNSYQGGSLVFFGLMEDERAKHLGFPLEGEEGVLIAFNSRLCHEVKPVLSGNRCTLVTWYF